MKLLVFNCRKVLEINYRKLLVSTCFLQAHNSVIFDTRFRNFDPTKAMKRCLEIEIGLPYVNFKSIGDYVILMCYYLKILGVTKTEIKAFIRDFEKITDEYRKAVNPNVANIVIRPDFAARMSILKNFI